jgi:hypothetical protein
MHFLDVTALEHLGVRLQDAVRPIVKNILSEDLRMVAQPPSFDAILVSQPPTSRAQARRVSLSDRSAEHSYKCGAPDCFPAHEGSVVQTDA